MASKPWFRLYNEVVDDPKVQRLPAPLFRSWINLLCIASRHDGDLPPLEDIAFGLRCSPHEASAILAALTDAGLLDPTPDGHAPHGWTARQFASDLSTPRVQRHREQAAERFTERFGNVSEAVSDPSVHNVKRFMERFSNVAETANETDQSRAETETELTSAIALVPSAAPSGRRTRPAPKPKDRERARLTAHPLFEPLVAIFDRPVGDEWALWGKVVAELAEKGATPEQVPRAALGYRRLMGHDATGRPIPLTCTALLRHWKNSLDAAEPQAVARAAGDFRMPIHGELDDAKYTGTGQYARTQRPYDDDIPLDELEREMNVHRPAPQAQVAP